MQGEIAISTSEMICCHRDSHGQENQAKLLAALLALHSWIHGSAHDLRKGAIFDRNDFTDEIHGFMLFPFSPTKFGSTFIKSC